MNDKENLEYKHNQIDEAMSDMNRHFYKVNNEGRDGTEEELMMWYIENGGAEGYAKRVEEHEKTNS